MLRARGVQINNIKEEEPVLTRRISLLLAILMLVLCGMTPAFAQSQEPVTLRLMAMSTGDGNPEYDQLIADFTALYPWITIESEYLGIGDVYANALSTRLKGSDAPDIFHVGGGRAAVYSVIPFAEEGYIMDLSVFPWAEDVVPEAYHDTWWSGDQLCAIPLQLAPIVIEYNVGRFEELGIEVPQTMDEFMAAGYKAVEAGQPFIVLSGAHAGHSAHLIATIAMNTVYYGDPSWDAKRLAGEVTFSDTEGWHEAFNLFMEMFEADFFVPGSEGMDTNEGHLALANGDGLVRACPAGNMNIVSRLNDEIELRGIAMPGASHEETAISGMVTDGIAAFSGTQHPEEVALFMNFMIGGGGGDSYVGMTGNLSMADLLTGEVKNERLSDIAYLFETPGHVFDHPSNWPKAAAYQTLGKGVQALMTGLTTVDQLLQDIDVAWDAE